MREGLALGSEVSDAEPICLNPPPRPPAVVPTKAWQQMSTNASGEHLTHS